MADFEPASKRRKLTEGGVPDEYISLAVAANSGDRAPGSLFVVLAEDIVIGGISQRKQHVANTHVIDPSHPTPSVRVTVYSYSLEQLPPESFRKAGCIYRVGKALINISTTGGLSLIFQLPHRTQLLAWSPDLKKQWNPTSPTPAQLPDDQQAYLQYLSSWHLTGGPRQTGYTVDYIPSSARSASPPPIQSPEPARSRSTAPPVGYGSSQGDRPPPISQTKAYVPPPQPKPQEVERPQEVETPVAPVQRPPRPAEPVSLTISEVSFGEPPTPTFSVICKVSSLQTTDKHMTYTLVDGVPESGASMPFFIWKDKANQQPALYAAYSSGKFLQIFSLKKHVSKFDREELIVDRAARAVELEEDDPLVAKHKERVAKVLSGAQRRSGPPPSDPPDIIGYSSRNRVAGGPKDPNRRQPELRPPAPLSVVLGDAKEREVTQLEDLSTERVTKYHFKGQTLAFVPTDVSQWCIQVCSICSDRLEADAVCSCPSSQPEWTYAVSILVKDSTGAHKWIHCTGLGAKNFWAHLPASNLKENNESKKALEAFAKRLVDGTLDCVLEPFAYKGETLHRITDTQANPSF